MEAIDQYIERLSDPAVRAEHRRLNAVGESGPDVDHGKKATAKLVAAAEEALGVPLPPSYKKLVTTTEPYDNFPIYWVLGSDVYGGDVVSINDPALKAAPAHLITFVETDEGDEFCFDTRRADARGEYPIVRFDGADAETVAKDLGEFLLARLPKAGPSR
ncbi:SMI1/KNR4 family protein [Planctomyces sp. SH-PL62]|uniref:SMI1/KNR4 family protein n=1 Tax=Planctomyces sp. SH-PL62 TaxID=1636152 RepID=UPI00078B7383|nr:SMI1/KNR4 family protein [Planctomyces sp. SH-PL62]AMV38067.1 SMI1 / KNR4 family protein [Planctomyces sp. SH-PL62]